MLKHAKTSRAWQIVDARYANGFCKKTSRAKRHCIRARMY